MAAALPEDPPDRRVGPQRDERLVPVRHVRLDELEHPLHVQPAALVRPPGSVGVAIGAGGGTVDDHGARVAVILGLAEVPGHIVLDGRDVVGAIAERGQRPGGLRIDVLPDRDRVLAGERVGQALPRQDDRIGRPAHRRDELRVDLDECPVRPRASGWRWGRG